jgi:hypothetical protein
MFAEEPTMIKKAAALLVILATLGIASEATHMHYPRAIEAVPLVVSSSSIS